MVILSPVVLPSSTLKTIFKTKTHLYKSIRIILATIFVYHFVEEEKGSYSIKYGVVGQTSVDYLQIPGFLRLIQKIQVT